MRYPLLAFLLALALVVPARTEHCVTWSTFSPEIDTSLALCGPRALTEPCDGAIYVEHDLCQPECVFHHVMYYEENGIRGLQRDDKLWDDTCHGMIMGDFAAYM